MGETTTRRPAAPSPAERARTIAMRVGRAALLPSSDTSTRIQPLLHHVHPDGTATVLLADEHPLVGAAWQAPRGELGAMLEVTDPTPVRLREPVRGLLWLSGWLRVPEAAHAHADVLAVAEQRPDPRLLDAGHGATVLRLEPASLVLADSENTCPILPEEFTAASADPFCLQEDEWLRHLELSHRDVVGSLTRHLPDQLRGGHVRPLGLDRYGIRLRVESVDGDHDVRLAFSRPVADAEHLGRELQRLLGCPFLAAQRRQ
ncbi:uncharacterized protein DUF2470 [Halopolyspora algeriensis]|uniref:Uncharacterized protein DUF2470 n=1 Tax=Halopolyspora algeriensis TaxID=1500506 RepID=A0A368VYL4_9ACTN|nr:DUF2470 domain-containing protein [Halopolyspora algeriensis]RCW47308.1 uncharacterized protein DUF2470 [Halopolyspora algeriensis]TQM42543.1 uncharacterized protein DUF2470 [Halopolyspora algeriensis]